LRIVRCENLSWGGGKKASGDKGGKKKEVEGRKQTTFLHHEAKLIKRKKSVKKQKKEGSSSFCFIGGRNVEKLTKLKRVRKKLRQGAKLAENLHGTKKGPSRMGTKESQKSDRKNFFIFYLRSVRVRGSLKTKRKSAGEKSARAVIKVKVPQRD